MAFGALGLVGRLLFSVGTRPIRTVSRVAGAATTATVGAGVIDHVANEGQGRAAVLDGLTTRFNEVVGDRVKDQTFGLLAPIVGWDSESEEDRNTFEDWWAAIDPGAFGLTLGAIKAADLALEKTLGIDLLSNKMVMVAAIGYHLLITKGYGAQALNWVKEQSWAQDLGLDEGIAGISGAVREGIGNFNGEAAGNTTPSGGTDNPAPPRAETPQVQPVPEPVEP